MKSHSGICPSCLTSYLLIVRCPNKKKMESQPLLLKGLIVITVCFQSLRVSTNQPSSQGFRAITVPVVHFRRLNLCVANSKWLIILSYCVNSSSQNSRTNCSENAIMLILTPSDIQNQPLFKHSCPALTTVWIVYHIGRCDFLSVFCFVLFALLCFTLSNSTYTRVLIGWETIWPDSIQRELNLLYNSSKYC